MFILYALAVAIPLGLALGGRFERLGAVRIRGAWLALAGLAVQVVLFADPVASAVGTAGTPLYVASSAAVLVVVLANLRVPGLAVVALGAALNLAAIVANGGCMPADPGALSALGTPAAATGAYSNSCLREAPALAPLTDVFALPAWLPLANVFSVGDAIIAAGVAIAVVAGMRDPRGDHAEA